MVRKWAVLDNCISQSSFKKFVNKKSEINRSNPSVDSSSQNVNVVTKPIEK